MKDALEKLVKEVRKALQKPIAENPNFLGSLPQIGLRDPDKKSISWDDALKPKKI